MNRRGFLGSILALSAAPAIVRAQSLMPLRGRRLILPGQPLWPQVDPYWRAVEAAFAPQARLELLDAAGLTLARIAMPDFALGRNLAEDGVSGVVERTGVYERARIVRADGAELYTGDDVRLACDQLVTGGVVAMSYLWFECA